MFTQIKFIEYFFIGAISKIEGTFHIKRSLLKRIKHLDAIQIIADNFIKSKNEQEQEFGNRLNDILKIEQKNLFVGTGIGILFSFFLIFGLLTLLILEFITSSNFKLTYIVSSLLISLYILYIFVYKIEYIQQKLNIELSEIEKTVKQFILDVQKDNEIPK